MVKVNTREYENTWGKNPRGFGHWMVQIGNLKQTFVGKYSEAIKTAKEAARILGETEIVILP